MSEIPKKDQQNEMDLTENKAKTDEQLAKERIERLASNENTTLFVKHVYDTKKPAKKGDLKRTMTVILAVVICVAIGGSVFLINKFMPNDDKPDISGLETLSIDVLKPTDIIKPSSITVDGRTVEVESNLKSVSIYNHAETFSFAPYYKPAEKKTDTTSSTASTAKTYEYDTLWRINGINEQLTVSSKISDIIEDFLSISASQAMENTFASAAEYQSYYGIDNPTREVIFEFNDGTEDLIITVGSQVPTGDSYYLKHSKDERIFVVATTLISAYDSLPTDFGDTTIIDKLERNDSNKYYFNDNAELARFDSIKIYGSKFHNKTYDFIMSTGVSADFMPYVMKSPYTRPANNDFIAEILGIAGSKFTATSLYAYNATPETLKLCGFNDPMAVLDVKIGDHKFILSIGGSLDSEGKYLAVMVDNKPQIFKVASTKFEFLIAASANITKMLNDNFILENIVTLKGVTFTDKTGTHAINLSHTKRTDSENAYNTEVKYNGNVMDASSFKQLYQRVLMMSLIDYTLEAEKTQTVLKIDFDFIEGGRKTVEITESPNDTSRYLAWVDGVVMGKVLKATANDVIDGLAIFVSGGKVPEI